MLFKSMSTVFTLVFVQYLLSPFQVSAHDPQTGLPYSYSITTLDTAALTATDQEPAASTTVAAAMLPYLTRPPLPVPSARGYSPYLANPYATNPYMANPYLASPYAANPYLGNPYMGNPYLANSYAANPYAANPYGVVPPQASYYNPYYAPYGAAGPLGWPLQNGGGGDNQEAAKNE